MFDLTLSQALGVSSKKESDVAASSKLNKVTFFAVFVYSDVVYKVLQLAEANCIHFCQSFSSVYCMLVLLTVDKICESFVSGFSIL